MVDVAEAPTDRHHGREMEAFVLRLFLLASAMALSVVTAASAQAPTSVCNLADHPQQYAGKRVSVRGGIVDGSPHGVFLAAHRIGTTEVCLVFLGAMSGGGKISEGVLKPAEKVVGSGKRAAWATFSGVYVKKPPAPGDEMTRMAMGGQDLYLLDRFSVEKFELGDPIY